MKTLREEAQAYEPPQILNVADLEKFSIETEVQKDTGKDKEGNEFEYHYIEVDGKKYRVPGSVLGGIKNILKRMPHIKEVCVLKEGHGLNTRYQVLPWTPTKQ